VIGSRFLRNADTFLPDYTASRPRKHKPSKSTSRKPQTSKVSIHFQNLKSIHPFPKQSLPLRFCHQYVSCISSMPAAILLSRLIYCWFKKPQNDVRTNAACVLVVWYKINKPHYIVQFWITVDFSIQITERTILPIPNEYNASFVTACWRTILRNIARPTILGCITLISALAFPISLIKFKKLLIRSIINCINLNSLTTPVTTGQCKGTMEWLVPKDQVTTPNLQ